MNYLQLVWGCTVWVYMGVEELERVELEGKWVHNELAV